MAKHRLPDFVKSDLLKAGRAKVLTMSCDLDGCWWGWRHCGDAYFIRRLGKFNPWSW